MRVKRFLSYALALVILLSNGQIGYASEIGQEKEGYSESINAVGAEITSGNYIYTVNNDSTSATITKYLGNEVNVSIPERIDKYKVTSLGEFTFSNNTSITNIVIPKTVTSMGMYSSFIAHGAANLENIFVDSNNPDYYDENGVLYERITRGNSLGEYPEGKKAPVFKIPSNVVDIGLGAFWGISNLKKVYIPSTVKVVAINSFGDMTLEIYISNNSGMRIDSSAFKNMLPGTKIIVPNAEMRNKVTAAIYPVGSSNVEVINLADASDEDKAKYSSPATSLSFTDGSKSKFVTWDANKTYTLYDLYKVTSAQDFCTETVNWTVSDANMATVDNAAQTVKIKERSGDFDLTGTTDSGSFSIVLHVKAYVPTKSCTAPADIETSIGNTGSLALKFDPITAYAAANVTWASSNPDVVSVTSEKMSCGDNREGVSVVANYKAESVGQSMITATVDDNGNKYTKGILVTVSSSIQNFSVSDLSTYNFDYFSSINDQRPQPEVTVSAPDGKILTKGSDYTVSYDYQYWDQNQGYCNVKINGINDYSGSITKNFRIERNRIDMKDVNVSLPKYEYEFDSNGVRPDVTVSYQGRALVRYKDYFLSYENMLWPGTASAVVKGTDGRGWNTGEQRVNFTITQKSSNGNTNPGSDNTEQKPAITGVKDSYVKSYGDKAFTIKATGKGKISYTTSNKKVATVGATNGKITPKGIGSTTITIKSSDAVKKVTIQVVPKKPSVKAGASGSKAIKVSWKKDSQATGYQIQVSTSSKFKGSKTYTIKKNKTTSYTVKKLKSKKKYYVQMRSYKTVSGKKYYSSWSSKKSVKVK